MAQLQHETNFRSVSQKSAVANSGNETISYIKELQKANEEIHLSRRAALNALEDAILTKEALHITEERIRGQNEAFRVVINGGPLEDSLNALSRLVIKETAGEARTSFHMGGTNGISLHTIRGAGNMPEEYANEIDGFAIGQESLAFGVVMSTSSPVITPDVFEESQWKPWLHVAEKHDYRGCWSFPITTKANKAVGAFVMYFRTPRKATAKDLALAEIVTQTAAIIISNHTETQERVRAEEALRRSEEQLKVFNTSLEQQVQERTEQLAKQHSLLKQAEELAKAGSWEYTVNTQEFLWSEGMYRLFEITQDQPVRPEVYLEHALKEDLPVAKKIVDAIRQNFEAFEETMRIKFNDSYRTIQIKAAPLKNEKGEVEKMLGVDLDMTQARQSTEKIAELNRSLLAINKEMNSLNTELKTFTSIAANNYSETLRHLYINLEMIVTNDARNLSNSGRANLRRAQGAIQKMKLTTDDLVSLSKLHESDSREIDVDLTVIVQKVIDDFRDPAEHARVAMNCDHLPSITGYPILLFQMFHQLMDNAIKFRKSDTGHVVNVTCKESVNELVDQEMTDKNARYNVISVTDNGIGFPPEESEAIFKMFYRLHEKNKYKGSGTGLALCKRIMEMHGGFITAEGIPGEGASFHCYFPVGAGQLTA